MNANCRIDIADVLPDGSLILAGRVDSVEAQDLDFSLLIGGSAFRKERVFTYRRPSSHGADGGRRVDELGFVIVERLGPDVLFPEGLLLSVGEAIVAHVPLHRGEGKPFSTFFQRTDGFVRFEILRRLAQQSATADDAEKLSGCLSLYRTWAAGCPKWSGRMPQGSAVEVVDVMSDGLGNSCIQGWIGREMQLCAESISFLDIAGLPQSCDIVTQAMPMPDAAEGLAGSADVQASTGIRFVAVTSAILGAGTGWASGPLLVEVRSDDEIAYYRIDPLLTAKAEYDAQFWRLVAEMALVDRATGIRLASSHRRASEARRAATAPILTRPRNPGSLRIVLCPFGDDPFTRATLSGLVDLTLPDAEISALASCFEPPMLVHPVRTVGDHMREIRVHRSIYDVIDLQDADASAVFLPTGILITPALNGILQDVLAALEPGHMIILPTTAQAERTSFIELPGRPAMRPAQTRLTSFRPFVVRVADVLQTLVGRRCYGSIYGLIADLIRTLSVLEMELEPNEAIEHHAPAPGELIGQVGTLALVRALEIGA